MSVKNFYAGLILILSSFNALAICPKIDTTPSKPHKISKQEFLQQYGKDDSTRALINYYFRERNRSKRGILVTSGVTILSTIAADNLEPGAGVRGMGIFWVITAGISAIVVAAHIAIVISTSRKKLYKMLEDYNKGIPLPKKITNSRLYKKHYDKEKRKTDN